MIGTATGGRSVTGIYSGAASRPSAYFHMNYYMTLLFLNLGTLIAKFIHIANSNVDLSMDDIVKRNIQNNKIMDDYFEKT
jgi:hypothetical protein